MSINPTFHRSYVPSVVQYISQGLLDLVVIAQGPSVLATIGGGPLVLRPIGEGSLPLRPVVLVCTIGHVLRPIGQGLLDLLRFDKGPVALIPIGHSPQVIRPIGQGLQDLHSGCHI